MSSCQTSVIFAVDCEYLLNSFRTIQPLLNYYIFCFYYIALQHKKEVTTCEEITSKIAFIKAPRKHILPSIRASPYMNVCPKGINNKKPS